MGLPARGRSPRPTNLNTPRGAVWQAGDWHRTGRADILDPLLPLTLNAAGSLADRRAILLLALLSLPAAGGGVYAQTPPALDASADVTSLARAAADPQAKPDDRDEAARRLVERGTDESRRAIGTLLSANSPAPARLAAARAVAEVGAADPAYLPPLLAAASEEASRPLLAAAVDALSLYQSDSRVPDRLAELTQSTRPAAVRLAAIDGLGRFPTRPAAARLAALLDDPDPAISTAAAGALQSLTGRAEVGINPRAWWAANQGKSDVDFRADLLGDRAVRSDRDRRRVTGLSAEVRRLVQSQYRAAAPDKRPALMTAALSGAEPSVRAAGADLAYDQARTVGVVPDLVKGRLRDLIADSDPVVRKSVARAIQVINDPAALGPLLAQLGREPDSSVRAAIVSALGPIRDPRATAALVPLVNDPSPEVAVAAAGAIEAAGPALRDDPASAALVGQAADALRRVVASNREETVRLAAIQATGPLRRRELIPALRDVVIGKPKASAALRRAALAALGEEAEPNLADLIVSQLDDPDPPVRAAAARALGATANTFEYAEALYRHLDPANEPDRAVRDEAWKQLQVFFPLAPKQQLAAWPDRFADQPRRQLIVLQALADAADKAREPADAAFRRQQMGDVYMALAEPDKAAPLFRKALDFAMQNRAAPVVVLALNESLLKALLRAKDYAGATAFGSKLLAESPDNQGTVGPLFKLEVERLVKEGQWEDCRRLVDQALALNPPLRDPYLSRLKEQGAEARRKLAGRQSAAGPQSAGRREVSRGAAS